MTRAQHISREKMSNFTAVFWQKIPDFTDFFVVICTKDMLLTVILLLSAMLTAGPDRLYRVARSHVQL